MGSIVTAGGPVVFENGRKGVFSGLCSVGQLWQHLRTPLTEGLSQTWATQQQKGQESSWCQAIHALVPPFVLTTIWQEAAYWCALALEIASLLQKRMVLALLGNIKLTVFINCAPNLTGYLLSSMPNDWMADIGSTWKLLIFSCFLCFPLTVINNCSEGNVTVTREQLRQPNTLGLVLWFLKLRLTCYQKLFCQIWI